MRLRFTILLILVIVSTGRAQDAQFSQFFSSPTTLNPALAGLFSGRYRVALNHRSQWSRQLETPFSTSAFAADFHYDLKKKRRDTDSFGAGVYFLNDRLAEVGLSRNQFMISAAFHKTLDARGEKLLSVGAQGGIVQHSLGYGELTFQDQFDGTSVFVPGAGGELLPENSVSFGDFQLGLNYSMLPRGRGIGVFTGLAVHHLTAPEQSFYATATVGQETEVTNSLHRRYAAYLNFRVPSGRDATLSPRLYVSYQGPHRYLVTGTTLRLLTDDAGGRAVHLGGWLRVVNDVEGTAAESVTALFGLEVSSFLFGLSYDLGINGRRVNPRHQGSFELSITYIGLSEDDEAVPCPKF